MDHQYKVRVRRVQRLFNRYIFITKILRQVIHAEVLFWKINLIIPLLRFFYVLSYLRSQSNGRTNSCSNRHLFLFLLSFFRQNLSGVRVISQRLFDQFPRLFLGILKVKMSVSLTSNNKKQQTFLKGLYNKVRISTIYVDYFFAKRTREVVTETAPKNYSNFLLYICVKLENQKIFLPMTNKRSCPLH